MSSTPPVRCLKLHIHESVVHLASTQHAPSWSRTLTLKVQIQSSRQFQLKKCLTMGIIRRKEISLLSWIVDAQYIVQKFGLYNRTSLAPDVFSLM